MSAMTELRGSDLVGRLVEGRYQILSVIGTGGMGITYLASDQRHYGRHVAIKVPHEEFLSIRNFRERFTQEIQQLTKREHPHIVKLYDSGQIDGVPYAVLQHLPGGSLRDRMKSARGPLSAADVLRWLPGIADALDFIHRTVLHRDVKPENILFDAEGHSYLVDFGIAKVLADPTLVTKTGMVMGSPPYMAPEPVTCKPLGSAYDQYGLAVVVYEALSGRYPHAIDGDDQFAMLMLKATQPPTSLHRLNRSICRRASAAVKRALSADPADRFKSCREFATEFAEGPATRGRVWPFAAAAAALLIASLPWYFSGENAVRNSGLTDSRVPPDITASLPSPVPTHAQTPIADSRAEFSCTQGMNNWYYGYYTRDGSLITPEFRPMTQCVNDSFHYPGFAWRVDRALYWTSVRSAISFPNGPASCGRQRIEHWAVRRWSSEVSGTVTVTGTIRNVLRGFDGFTAHILVNGVSVFSRPIAGAGSTVPAAYAVTFAVTQGSSVDFVVQPNASDCNDHAEFIATITAATAASSISAPAAR